MAEQFDRYRVERRIAVGGMAEVCLARQMGPSGFDRVCVLKRMHRSLARSPELVELFLHEARLTAQLNHPNIAQVYDFGQFEGRYFLVMEHVDGPSLRQLMGWYGRRREWAPLPLVCHVVSEVAAALDAAHRARGPDGQLLDLVHRDVSPSNVLLSVSGVTKLIDFGIAKTTSSAVRTEQGLVRGKVAYMSPEHVRGETLDGRSDVYSLCLVLYELLASVPAVTGESDLERMENILRDRIRPLESIRTGLPDALVAVVRRGLSPDRANRFQTAAELAKALDDVMASQGWNLSPAQVSVIAEQAKSAMAPLEPTATPVVEGSECPSESALEQLTRGALAAAEAEPVRRHLEHCETCRRVVALTSPDFTAKRAAPREKIGRYEVISELGSGVMGMVLKAHDPQLDRMVALKLMLSPDRSPEARERMIRESQAAARVRHSNVVTVYDFGLHGDELFVAMEYVEGTTLRAWAQRPDLSADEKMRVLLEVGRGLEAIHAADLVHRDIKPENILVDSAGHGRVADFGMVREADSDMTRPGQLLGTPAYMAPEQLAGQRATAASDQFAYCAVVYECLTGQRPFVADSILSLRETISTGVTTSGWAPIARPVRRVLRRGLAGRSAERYGSMTELLRALEDAVAAPGPVGWAWQALGGLVVVAAVVVVTWRAAVHSNSVGPTPPPPVVAAAVPTVTPPTPSVRAEPAHDVSAPVSAAPPPTPAPVPPVVVPKATRAPMAMGTVRVESTPPADISLDGKPAGKSPKSLTVSVGAHVVRLKLTDGHAARDFSIRVEPNQEQRVTWAPQRGSLEIRAVPPEVEFRVSLDGQALGVTPLADVPVFEGQHRLAVTSDSNWSATKTIDVRPNERARVKLIQGSGIEVVRPR